MFSNLSNKISWIYTHRNVFKKIQRGIERESLRITLNGKQSITNHPKLMGSPLTHKWITTDFSENCIEFVTPTTNKINFLLTFLTDIYRYTCKNLDKERMWALSMPFFDSDKQLIKIANYGTSNIGIKKNIYRQGLKYRYGTYMNTITGVHYNFSLPLDFWRKWKGIKDINSGKEIISNGYLSLIRNYYRFGWIIPYLFGSSPTISSYMVKNNNNSFKFVDNQKKTLYMPWATSLRVSSFGYQNKSLQELQIKFNSISDYITQLKHGMNTPVPKYIKIGIKDKEGNFKQINTNLLQMENELYAQIRPKPIILNNESYIDALEKRGIAYVEIRSLDINPFSSIGINKNQIILLDLFLIWCSLNESPLIDNLELKQIFNNWETIAIEGRRKNISIYIKSKENKVSFIEIANLILLDLYKIAKILDEESQFKHYQYVCTKAKNCINNPNLTYSAQILKYIIKLGMKKTGLHFSNKYYDKHVVEPFEYITNEMFIKECNTSLQLQSKMEKITNFYENTNLLEQTLF